MFYREGLTLSVVISQADCLEAVKQANDSCFWWIKWAVSHNCYSTRSLFATRSITIWLFIHPSTFAYSSLGHGGNSSFSNLPFPGKQGVLNPPERSMQKAETRSWESANLPSLGYSVKMAFIPLFIHFLNRTGDKRQPWWKPTQLGMACSNIPLLYTPPQDTPYSQNTPTHRHTFSRG